MNKKEVISDNIPHSDSSTDQQFKDETEKWFKKIEEGSIHFSADGYEDYSLGYWDTEWIPEYSDEFEISQTIRNVIEFAKRKLSHGDYQVSPQNKRAQNLLFYLNWLTMSQFVLQDMLSAGPTVLLPRISAPTQTKIYLYI